MKKPIRNILVYIITLTTTSLVLGRGDIDWGMIIVGCVVFSVMTLVGSYLKDE